MAFTAYATLPETKSWLMVNDTIDDVEITDELDAVTGWIDEYCQRHFWQDGASGDEVARVSAACDRRVLELGPFHDLVSVTTLKTDEDGDGVFETTWAATDYELQPVSRPTGRPFTKIEAIGSRLFPVPYSRGSGATGRVEITGVWGWPAVPKPVNEACKIETVRRLMRRYAPERVDPAEYGVVIDDLDPYRQVAVLVG